MFAWLVGSGRSSRVADLSQADDQAMRLRRVGVALSTMRIKLSKRVKDMNQMTADEVTSAARLVNDVVERARSYVQESQRALGRIEGRGKDSVGQLLGSQSALLRDHIREMSGRAAVQDERARQAALAAKNISDLAASIERLAGEARLLAVNARIESSRLGAHSAGFEVLASEMQRLSDEVAGANERVSELAASLGTDLPWIAQHARDLRGVLEGFAVTAAAQLEETERGVTSLQADIGSISRGGAAVMEDILRASHSALSHLQFQDVVAQELRLMDERMRTAHVEVAQVLGADDAVMAEIPPAEYLTQGSGDEGGPMLAPSGDVVLF